MIPFLDLAVAHRAIRAELADAVTGVLDGGWYVLGRELEAFEEEFAAYCGARHCIGVGNGLDAIFLLLKAAGIGPGDEVIVPTDTYIATWLGVTRTGATVVPVEPLPGTYNLDPDLVAAAITERTRAVFAVHLYGQPADMARLAETCAARSVLLFEDAAQAHGARSHGRRTGALGDGAAFSFYPTKNLGALGDGGAVVVDDDGLADEVRLLRNYGSRRKYHNELQGVNSRLDDIQAAALRVKLRHLDAWNARRAELAAGYGGALSGVAGLVVPEVPEWAQPAWHVYVVRHPRRDALASNLRDQGIGTLIYYPVPPHLSGAYRHLGYAPGSFPIAEEIAATNLALPLHPDLSDADLRRVVAAVGRFGAA